MKLLHSVIPNLTISMNMVMLIVVYLDMRNPKMGFMGDTPYYVLAVITAIVSLISAVTLYASYRKKQKEQNNPENNLD